MALSWLGIGKKKKTEASTTEEKQTTSLNDPLIEENNPDMEWFDDIVDGAHSGKGDKQILTKLWEQISGENMISRLRTPKQRSAATIWGTLCHRCDIAYPPPNKLKPINISESKDQITELKYAVRHAIAAYPPMFICFMGLKADVAFALKSNKAILKSAFNIEAKDVIVDNCSNNLISLNSTHQPAFYLCVDHTRLKIIVSIRGSSTVADALTDVNAICKEYSAHGVDGYVHEGIMAAAKFVFDKVTKDLIKTCETYLNYQVIITGHSLGAGVASILGLMYREHSVIHKQNNLEVYAFASPPVISHEFVDKHIGEEYITSVALTTDIVTRLSLESIKQQNCRFDVLMDCDQNTLKNLMTDLKDSESDGGSDATEEVIDESKAGETVRLECTFVKYEYNAKKNAFTYTLELKDSEHSWTLVKRYNAFKKLNIILQNMFESEESNSDIKLPLFPDKKIAMTGDGKEAIAQERMDKLAVYMKFLISNKETVASCAVRNFLDIPVSMGKSLKLIRKLQKTATPNPKDQLFPLGKILWFVPKCCMNEDVVQRRKTLMCLKSECDRKENSDSSEGKTETKKQKKGKYKTERANSFSGILSNTWHNLQKGFEEFQDAMDNPLIKGGAKLAKEYDGSHYVLCEATEHRALFQEMVLELPESLASHMPNRYIWAFDAHLTRGDLY